jgi:hypothetical protein
MTSGQWYATLGGERIISGEIIIPLYGMITADVVLAVPDANAQQPVIQWGNASYQAAVVRMASYSGSRSARLVGGFGGWGTTLEPRAWSLPGGVSMAQVLTSTAAECGEKVNVPVDRTIPSYFRTGNENASQVLFALAGPVWYVDGAGVTQVQNRPSSTITNQFDVLSYSGGKGLFEVGTEDPASWVPGAIFSTPVVTTPQTISLTRLKMDRDGTVRLHVLVQDQAATA